MTIRNYPQNVITGSPISIGTSIPKEASTFKPAEIALIVSGTTDEITVTDNKNGTITLSLPSTIKIQNAAFSDLTDGYLPYHVSDTAGLSDSPLFTDGTNIGIGIDPEELFHVADGADDAISILDVFSTTNQHCGRLQFRKSTSNTVGTLTAVGTGDWLGYIEFKGVGNAGTYQHGAYIKAVQDTLNLGDYVATLLELGASDKDGNITGEIAIDGNTGYIGLGLSYTPCSTVEIADWMNIVTLTNTDRASGDIDGAHGSSLVWRGFKDGGGIYDSHTLGKIILNHEGAEADEKSRLDITLNSGTRGHYDQRRMFRLSSNGEISYVSGLNICCNDDEVVCHNDAAVFVHPLWVYGVYI